MNDFFLEFEKPLRDLEYQIKELKESTFRPEVDFSSEIKALEKKVNVLIKDIYENLSPWDRVLLSRHPQRPHTIDYINGIFTSFKEVHGDRYFADDPAMVAGFGFIGDQRVCVIGIEKGRKTKEKVKHNFGMARPEGYRKALRTMKLASRFNIPIITLIDTPGAYPGIGAEERGQAHAIAVNIAEMFDLDTPVLSIVIGEGGSGGALGIGIGDKVLMMEYSVYSVISPESCASILWADPKKADTAACSLQLGPEKALELKVVDGTIREPSGGAHRDPEKAIGFVKEAIEQEIKNLLKVDLMELRHLRAKKYRSMGNTTIQTK